MSGIAVVATGVFAALLVGAISGSLPRLRRREPPATPSELAQQLRRAGLRISPGVCHLISAGLVLVVVALVWAVSAIPSLAIVPAALAGILPRAWVARRAATRAAAVRQAWPDALAQISGSVRTGRPLSHALIDVSLDGPEALRGPLSGLAARIQTVGLVPALQAVADSVADPATDRVVEVLCLAHSEGGHIVVEVVRDLADSIAQEVQTGEELDTLALEGRLNARMVFAIPWLVLVMLTSQAGPFQAFYRTAGGAVVIVVGAVASLLGLVLVRRLSQVPAEPRVLRPEEVGA